MALDQWSVVLSIAQPGFLQISVSYLTGCGARPSNAGSFLSQMRLRGKRAWAWRSNQGQGTGGVLHASNRLRHLLLELAHLRPNSIDLLPEMIHLVALRYFLTVCLAAAAAAAAAAKPNRPPPALQDAFDCGPQSVRGGDVRGCGCGCGWGCCGRRGAPGLGIRMASRH